MKKYGLRLLVGSLTFGIGITSVAFWIISGSALDCSSSRRIEKTVDLIEPTKEFNLADSRIKSGKITFVFQRFIEDSDLQRAEFLLINDTGHDINYVGYEKIEGSYCSVDYRQKGKTKRGPGCCGTGLGTNVLKSGEAQTINIWLPDWKNVNQIGFHILDENRNELTIWSNKF